MFIAQELALSANKGLRPLVDKKDSHLADQVRRAGVRSCLNIAEANKLAKGNRNAKFRLAHGEANEARVGLQLAIAWSYLTEAETADVDATLDRLGGMLFSLTN